jgi:hypothetical protein
MQENIPAKVSITNNFEHLSKVASDIVKEKLIELSKEKKIVLGLARKFADCHVQTFSAGSK